MGVAQKALELARGGAQTGEFVYCVSDVQECTDQSQDECCELAFDSPSAPARPSSGEKPFEVASFICKECSICYKDQVIASIKATAGYHEGMFAVVSIAADSGSLSSAFDVAGNTELLAKKVSELVVQSVSVWEQQVKGARSFAGPIALILSDYFDMVPLLGQQVNKVYPSGNVALTARFGGIDVWGHAILVDQDGKEILVSEDEASVVPAV